MKILARKRNFEFTLTKYLSWAKLVNGNLKTLMENLNISVIISISFTILGDFLPSAKRTTVIIRYCDYLGTIHKV